MGVQINEYDAVYVKMRLNSFAFVAMSLMVVALMCSIIPGSFGFVYAEEDESSQDNDSEEENQHDGDESDNEEEGDNARSQDDDDGDDDESDDDDGDDSDSSKTGTEQESEQKNVCSGWAVCTNVATDAETSTIGGGSAAPTVTETPMLLSLPL